MIAMIFPDGQQRTFPVGTTGMEIAKGISSSLAKKAVAIRVDGHLLDLTRPLTAGGAFAIVTRDEDAALEVLRHDAAHVFAEAIKELFPAAQITIGPSIENGFYYDIHMEERILTPEDFPLIEKRMHEIVDRDEAITREVWDRQEAIDFFSSCGEHYKAEIIRDIPGEEPISLYRQGQFIDLCRGPHLPSTKALGHAFKLMRVAGAYWRGDSKNPMLQRIYGTAWATEAQLQEYLVRLEEAEKRDHRRLGKEMNLFHMQEEAVGSVFWHPKGWALYRTLESYMRRQLQRRDYQEVRTPQLLDKALWEASGHWEKFREGMFVLEDEDKSTLCLKPMNCPAHVQIFKQGLKSYRDLPYRLAEFGSCHRNEPSGALHGIMRVRAFTQDDAHIFCTPQQISDETIAFCRFLEEVYRDLGFDDFFVKFSDRPEKRAGSDETWDEAEEALKKGSEAAGLQWILNPGEGAFYGPKLEFVLRDAIGREWQCGTLQVDFVLPDRLDASYIGEDGKKHRPVMLHRAILGSFERFIGVLIEHYAGKFPFWMAPVQVAIVTITQEGDEFARAVHQQLSQSGIRVELDLRNEKINYKVREHSLQKIPLILAIGRREAENLEVSMRRLGSTDQTVISWAEAFEQIIQDAMPPC